MKILTAEILLAFPDVESIRTGPALASCYYLRASITEMFRMNPALPGIAIRTALHGGIAIDDVHFPEGTDIGTPTYALHHNEVYFPEPFRFQPERWILADNAEGTPGLATKESLELARSAWCAFSLGPRMCMGKAMAYQEISIVVGRLVWMFEMRLASNPGIEDRSGRMGGARQWTRAGEFQMNDKFSAESDGPWVEFRPRQR